MSVAAISPERIRASFAAYRSADPLSKWRADYQASVEHVAQFDAEALKTPATQEALWSLKSLATLGVGEGVNVQGAFTDPEIVAAIVGLRELAQIVDDTARARQIEAAYTTILDLVSARYSRRRPWAKLGRLFAALLPRELHAGFSTASRAAISRALRGTSGDGWAAAHVLDRARLREILGPEKGLDDDAWRATFCWWLFENAESIARGEAEAPAGKAFVDQAPAPLPPLPLLPAARLRRGFVAFQGYAETVRLIVESTVGGATPDDIAESLRSNPGYEAMAPTHARRIFKIVRTMGMLEHRGGLWYPSGLGERLLDDPRYDPLTAKMLAEVFGFAHYLRLLAGAPMTRKDCNRQLREVYPAWTTNRAPSSIAAWARSLGLVQRRDDGRAELTEYGEEWESRLPAELPVPPLRAASDDDVEALDEDEDDDDANADAVDVAAPPPRPTLAELGASMAAARPDFVQDPSILRALHLAWHGIPGKRFVIFSGLSGTGKTLLFTLYAEAYCRHLGIDVAGHLRVVPVSPDWRDPSGLIGYFNALHADPTYQAEPALRLILQAHRHPHLPYFLILDEMNLARVEHYFAPFLSAMETGGALSLHANEAAVNKVPPSIRWPQNLFIGGTVNMDETTHAISDKVLDRAFTVEFWDVELTRYFAHRAASNGHTRNVAAEKLLLELHAVLRGVRRHFGYRAAGEVLAMLDAARAEGIDDGVQAEILDQALFSKVLPRIRGQESEALREALARSRALCAGAGLSRCADKLGEMEAGLRETGLTRFWA